MSATPQKVLDETSLAEFIRDRGPHCLILARHGETKWNAEGRLQGQRDTQLNQRGRNQALALGRFLGRIPVIQIHSSTLGRCQRTAIAIAEANVGRPSIVGSDLLKETALGILEGELKDQQSTPELTRYYELACSDEIRYRVPQGENLQDVAARVQHFFDDASQLLTGPGVHLIVGHRNVNKMILKHLLGLSFEEGFQIEHEHRRVYFYFAASQELWSCLLEGTQGHLMQGYATVMGSFYA